MNKVLITGGAGFIGYHLALKLAGSGCQVVLADNFSRGVKDRWLEDISSRSNVDLIHVDLLDQRSVESLGNDYSHIFHLAAIIGVQHVLRAPYDVLTKNFELLSNIIDVSRRQHSLQRLVFTSTSEIYAGTLRNFSLQIPTPETSPLSVTDLAENRTSYMLSKIYGEAMCLHSGLPVTIIRPHNFYGPRMGLSHVIPELFRKAIQSTDGTLEVFSPDHMRTFCYIDDAVSIMAALAKAEAAAGEAFNVGRQAPELTIRELAQMIIRIAGRDLSIREGQITAGSPSRRCPSMNKTIRISGMTPLVSVEEGLRMTFRWYMDNVFQGEGISAV